MTPERARFHLHLLTCGERALLDAEIDAALAADGPLSALILDLSVCRSDDETAHVLQEYLLDHPAAPEAVEALLRGASACRTYGSWTRRSAGRSGVRNRIPCRAIRRSPCSRAVIPPRPRPIRQDNHQRGVHICSVISRNGISAARPFTGRCW